MLNNVNSLVKEIQKRFPQLITEETKGTDNNYIYQISKSIIQADASAHTIIIHEKDNLEKYRAMGIIQKFNYKMYELTITFYEVINSPHIENIDTEFVSENGEKCIVKTKKAIENSQQDEFVIFCDEFFDQVLKKSEEWFGIYGRMG